MVYISLTWGEMIKICVKVPKKNEFVLIKSILRIQIVLNL